MAILRVIERFFKGLVSIIKSVVGSTAEEAV